MELTAEFTTEPFHGEGEPPAHVGAAAAALADAGLEPDLGPFGTAVTGDVDRVLPALEQAMAAAFASGATRFTLQVGLREGMPGAH